MLTWCCLDDRKLETVSEINPLHANTDLEQQCKICFNFIFITLEYYGFYKTVGIKTKQWIR